MAKIEVRVVSILFGALALAVALILVFAPPGETQTGPEADLELDKSAFPDVVAVGDKLQFFLQVSNLGPNVATDVTVTDVLPANVILLDTSTSEGVNCTSAGNTVTCNFADLGPGIGGNVFIDVCPTEPGIVENTATVSSVTADPNPANNTDTTTTTVIPETPEPCPDPDPGPDEPPIVDGDGPLPDGPLPSEEPLPTDSPTTIFAPSIDADQETDQDSGDVDQQMEGSPGGTQNANTGNFAAPNQDINW